MVDVFVFVSNMAFGLAVGLWGLKYFILRKKYKQNKILSEADNKKLKFCKLGKYFFVIFIVLKILLVLLR